MSNVRNKFTSVNPRPKLPKEVVSHIKPRSPIVQIKVMGRCNESIKQLEKVRSEKEELMKAIPVKPTMNVWERLSKAKRSLNENGQVVGNPYRHELCIKTRQESNVYTPPHATYRLAKGSPPGIYGIRREPQKHLVRKPLNLATGDNFILNKSMTNLMLPRKISDSSTSMEEMTPKNSTKSLGSIQEQKSSEWNAACIIESEDKFESATSVFELVRQSPSARIAQDFRTALEKRCCFMSPEDINVIKNYIKTDKRLSKGKYSNEDVFCDIIRAKLKEISREEHILRTALQNLGHVNEKPLLTPKQFTKPCKKPQVHVILRNVPNAQREVVILRALGERLEKTLKHHPQIEISKKSACTITPEMHTARQLHFILGTLHYAVGRVRVQAVCMHIAFVREFSIANKTINDLKNEKRQFYLPANDKHTELRRTSFKRLRENPKLFMSFLQSKNSLVPFNVLENDTMFFNSIFYDTNQDNTPTEQFSDDEETVVISDPYESRRYFMKKEALKIEEIPLNSCTPIVQTQNIQEGKIGDMPPSYAGEKIHFEEDISRNSKEPEDELKDCIKTTKQPESVDFKIKEQIVPTSRVRRHRIRKYVTPLPERKYVSPKNRILRFMVVGLMQLGLFMALFVSYVYPEIACINNLRVIKKNM